MSLDDKVLIACHRIEDLWHQSEGKCYISFSGGKDSTVVLALIKLCVDALTLPAEGIRAVFDNTGIEMGITVEFVKWCKENWYPNIEIIRPEKSFDWCLKTYGKPMKSKLRSEFIGRYQDGNRSESLMMNLIDGVTKKGARTRGTVLADKDMHMLHPDFEIHATPKCCTVLKKKPFLKYAKENNVKGMIYGIRQAEGGARNLNAFERQKKNLQPCTSIKNGIIQKAPIIDWADEDIEEFIQKYNVPLSKAYTEFGFHRTGCMGCPFGLTIVHNLRYLHDHEPNRYRASMHWLKDVYIAQNIKLPFDPEYEREREQKWDQEYEPMRQEMLRLYRPKSRLIKDFTETKLFY